MTRRNLCPNPAAKTNATGFSGTAAPSRITGLSGFPRTTGVTAGGSGYIQSPTAACAPGDTLVVSLHANAGTTLGSKTVYAAFTRTAGGDDFSQTFSITVDATVRRASLAVTAPANATGVYLLFDGVGAGVNASGFMYEPGSVDGGYADGDTFGWSWDGTNGNSSSSENAGTDIPVSGTLSGSGSLSGTSSTSRPVAGSLAGAGVLDGALTSARAVAGALTSARAVAGALTGHGTLTGAASGGDTLLELGTQYEIEEIMDALAATWDGVPTGDTIGGTALTMECHPEIVGSVNPPSLVLELDDQTWDLNMGHGADSLQVVALALVAEADQVNAQRLLWRFLSRKGASGLLRLKKALEDNQSLGGLVSYAVMTNVRNIGQITYNGVDYLGAELIIDVVT